MSCVHSPNMPCGFDVESLVDFETALTSTSAAFQSGGHCDDWTAISEFDSEALALIKDSSLDTTNKSCNSGHRSTGHGASMTSPSSYCRRMGSASGRRGSPLSFQLWSPRLRLRDERKRVLKMSLTKLRRIDDPESCLRRSVLLNNTLRRLQRESRDDKLYDTGKMADLPIPPQPEPAAKRRRVSADCVDDQPADPSRTDGEETPKKLPRATPAPPGVAPLGANQRPALRPCNSMAPSSGFSGLVASSGGAFDADKQFGSCGQSSLLFGELQSVVFHSLITSLES